MYTKSKQIKSDEQSLSIIMWKAPDRFVRSASFHPYLWSRRWIKKTRTITRDSSFTSGACLRSKLQKYLNSIERLFRLSRWRVRPSILRIRDYPFFFSHSLFIYVIPPKSTIRPITVELHEIPFCSVCVCVLSCVCVCVFWCDPFLSLFFYLSLPFLFSLISRCVPFSLPKSDNNNKNNIN